MTFKGSSFYQFEVQIETVFQQKQSVVININTKNDKFIDLQLENSKDIVFRYEEFKLKVIFYYLQCDPIEKLKKVNEKILLKIEQIINLQNNLNINFENQTMDNEHTINIQPYILVLDQQYDIKITVSDVNNSQIFQEIIHSFQVKKSQQIVKIQGLSNIQSFSNSFYVNAFIDNLDLSPSEKEVQKNNNYGIKTKWKCITAKSQSDCRDYKNDLIVDPNMEQNILQIKVQEKSLEAYNLYYFILEGEKDGIVVQDISSFIILEQNIPPLNSITSINDFSQRINLNQQIFVQLNYEGKNNLDNLFFSGAVLYQNDVKNTIKFFHNQVRFQTWNYFNDFLNEEENSYQIRFAVFDPQYIMPSLIIFSLKANLPPLNCLFKNFNNQQQEIFSLKQNYVFQINNCQDQDQPLYYNFFYYKSQEDFQYEILNPQFTKRYALNVKSTISRISTILPFGAKVIIGCVFDNLGAVRNMTQNVEIKNSYENVQQYVQLVQETYKIIIQIPFKQQIVIQLCILVQDIVSNILINEELKQDQNLIKIVKNIYEDLLFQQQKFNDNQDVQVQIQMTINLIPQNLLDQIMNILKYKDILDYLSKIEQTLIEQENIIKKIQAKDVQQYQQYFSSIQLVLQQVSSIQSIQKQTEGNFRMRKYFFRQQYVGLIQLSSEILNLNVIPNESQISQKNIVKSQKVSFKFLKQNYLTNSYENNEQQQNQDDFNDNEQNYENKQLFQVFDNQITYQVVNNQTNEIQKQPINTQLANTFTLPNPSNSTTGFSCLTQINNKWEQGNCNKVQQINKKKLVSSVICQCKKQGKQTLVDDIESIFTDNQNLKNMFSEQGIENLKNFSEWYKYVTVWIIYISNQFYIIFLVYLRQKDKAAIAKEKITDQIKQNYIKKSSLHFNDQGIFLIFYYYFLIYILKYKFKMKLDQNYIQIMFQVGNKIVLKKVIIIYSLIKIIIQKKIQKKINNKIKQLNKFNIISNLTKNKFQNIRQQLQIKRDFIQKIKYSQNNIKIENKNRQNQNTQQITNIIDQVKNEQFSPLSNKIFVYKLNKNKQKICAHVLYFHQKELNLQEINSHNKIIIILQILIQKIVNNYRTQGKVLCNQYIYQNLNFVSQNKNQIYIQNLFLYLKINKNYREKNKRIWKTQ
ncbi:hypothetical protein IMG5_072230 [Ichthyophthirius multifiliis]|uniref:F-box domain-containing protein n=1 Tax=Ichthyophthirius multifiliis TaxID=5932 RepID=G0QPX4_ICHMU|nr:hypothetical protein IMG5_072230 [Ichthyophthirius multifiliis]EGR32732.1 hypothetical protein IMG5_072230 [Ichthyophthirius multifiliis]|eukprot:XP_004036718.1 hypothetical protein IMG5_072230 [Ichthyophthirius multifiliis]